MQKCARDSPNFRAKSAPSRAHNAELYQSPRRTTNTFAMKQMLFTFYLQKVGGSAMLWSRLYLFIFLKRNNAFSLNAIVDVRRRRRRHEIFILIYRKQHSPR